MNVNLQVKQTIPFKIIFNTVLLLRRLRILSLETGVKITNYMIKKGAIKYRVDKGKWSILYDFGEIVVD